jgi:aryl-alcohol dehydrogenase-like predicted oxidoreductase
MGRQPRSLRTDKVDLLQIHNLRDWQTQLPYARELKQQGKPVMSASPIT